MTKLDIEVPSDPRAGKWAVETITCPDCGVGNVHVYIADLERIECDCGAWMLTALGYRRAVAAEARN